MNDRPRVWLPPNIADSFRSPDDSDDALEFRRRLEKNETKRLQAAEDMGIVLRQRALENVLAAQETARSIEIKRQMKPGVAARIRNDAHDLAVHFAAIQAEPDLRFEQARVRSRPELVRIASRTNRNANPTEQPQAWEVPGDSRMYLRRLFGRVSLGPVIQKPVSTTDSTHAWEMQSVTEVRYFKYYSEDRGTHNPKDGPNMSSLIPYDSKSGICLSAEGDLRYFSKTVDEYSRQDILVLGAHLTDGEIVEATNTDIDISAPLENQQPQLFWQSVFLERANQVYVPG